LSRVLVFICRFVGNLEAKILWLKNYERVQEIQQQIFWRPITEVEPRAFIPEVALTNNVTVRYRSLTQQSERCSGANETKI